MSLAHNDPAPPTLAFQPDAIQGEAACLQAGLRLAARPSASWLALPVCGGAAAHEFAPVLAAALGGSDTAAFPYAAIAAEAERPFVHGIRGATPLALLLLAALALAREDGGDGARALAGIALEMADRLGPRSQRQIRALHAALVAPFTGAFEEAVSKLGILCEDEAAPCCPQLYLAANGLMAGLPLSELAQQARQAAALPATDAHAAEVAGELAVRAALLESLMALRDAPAPAAVDAPQGRFGVWVTRLQAAVYAGDHARARQAAIQSDALAGPLLPAGDRMHHHLFAALAWAQSAESEAVVRLDRHCAALRSLARQLPACALVQCAEAARASQHGDRLGALQGFDGAGTEAVRQGRQALAALAWEQAAREAQACGLGAAVHHYRREALACWDQWGAAGRAAMLRQAWGEQADQRSERERILQAGRVGELGLSIAHEVNQPLAAISLHAAAARRWLRRSEPDIERALSSLSLISAAGQHAGDIVRSVQHLAAHKDQEMDSVPVDQTIVDTLRLLHRPLRKHAIEVELALGLEDCTIQASRVQLQQVLTNLLMNATEALAGGGAAQPLRRIEVRTRRCGEQEIEIAVADNGPGIAPEHASRVFGSMFSTKPNSTGMGLSISLAIVRAHGGRIDYEPCRPHGACFRLRLPVQSCPP